MCLYEFTEYQNISLNIIVLRSTLFSQIALYGGSFLIVLYEYRNIDMYEIIVEYIKDNINISDTLEFLYTLEHCLRELHLFE